MKKIRYVLLCCIFVFLIVSCGNEKEKDISEEKKVEINKKNNKENETLESTKEKRKPELILNEYNEKNKNGDIYWIAPEICIVYTMEEEKGKIDFLNIKSGEKINSLTDEALGKNIEINTYEQKVVAIGNSIEGNKKIWIFNNKYEIEDNFMLLDKMEENAFCILPEQKKIIYETYYGNEWRSCLKIANYDGTQEEVVIEFEDSSNLDYIDCIKASKDEKAIFFCGKYFSGSREGGIAKQCIGHLNLGKKVYKTYKEEKSGCCVTNKGAFFYDELEDDIDRDGKIVQITAQGAVSSWYTEQKIESGEVFLSSEGELLITLQISKKEEDATRIRIYQTSTGKKIFEKITNEIYYNAFILEKTQQFCGIFYDKKNGMSFHWIDIE